jgi:DedD protein
MDQARLKYRIVGGVVLVALAAILVPLLNDVRQPLPQGPQSIDIPAEPADGVAGRLPPDGPAPPGLVPEPQDVPPPLPAPPLEEAAESARAEPVPPPKPAVPKPAPVAKPVTPKAAPTTPAPALAKPATAPKTPVAAAVPAPATPAKPAAATPTPSAPSAAAQQAWVVQLGVYGNLKTAIDLREKLRKAGHSAFTEEVVTPHGKALRVRVGPELERATAQALRDRLARETGHDGIVMGYP